MRRSGRRERERRLRLLRFAMYSGPPMTLRSLPLAVDRLLTRVEYGTDVSAHPVTVGPGRPVAGGGTHGTASPRAESPKLLGAAARAADRIRRAEQIRKQISDLADDRELISLELDDVVGLLAALDTASDHLPSDSDVVTAVLAARDAAKRATDLQTEAEDADKIAEATQSAADASTATVAGHCDEHDCPVPARRWLTCSPHCPTTSQRSQPSRAG